MRKIILVAFCLGLTLVALADEAKPVNEPVVVCAKRRGTRIAVNWEYLTEVFIVKEHGRKVWNSDLYCVTLRTDLGPIRSVVVLRSLKK